MERARVLLCVVGAAALAAVAADSPRREPLTTALAGGGSPRQRLGDELTRLQVKPGQELVSAAPGRFYSVAPLSEAEWAWLAGGVPAAFWTERRADHLRITARPASGEVDVSLVPPDGVLPLVWGTLGRLRQEGRATRVSFRQQPVPGAVVVLLSATRWSADQEVQQQRGVDGRGPVAAEIPAGRFQGVEAYVLPVGDARGCMVALAVLEAVFTWGGGAPGDAVAVERSLRVLEDRVLGDWVEMDRLVRGLAAWLAVVAALLAGWWVRALVRHARGAVEPFTGLVPDAGASWWRVLVLSARGRARLVDGLELRALEALTRSHREEAALRFERWRHARIAERRSAATPGLGPVPAGEPTREEVRARAEQLRELVESDPLVPGPVRAVVLEQVAQALGEKRPRRAARFVDYAEGQYRAAKGDR